MPLDRVQTELLLEVSESGLAFGDLDDLISLAMAPEEGDVFRGGRLQLLGVSAGRERSAESKVRSWR